MRPRKHQPHLLVAGWLLAVAWLAALPGFLPAVFAAVALLDGEHGIEIRGGSDDVRVVLTHGVHDPGKTHDQIHHHRLLGRVLICCATSSAGDPDHVVQFGCSNSATLQRNAAKVPADDEAGVPVSIQQEVSCVISIPPPAEAFHSRAAVRERLSIPDLPGLQHSLLI